MKALHVVLYTVCIFLYGLGVGATIGQAYEFKRLQNQCEELINE